MRQLAGLTAFLVGLDLVAAEQIDAWAENPQAIPAGTVKGANTIVLFRLKYDAMVVIERFPHRVHDPELLFGQVCAWLMEHDGDDIRSDNSEAVIHTEVDILDDETADIIMTIDFLEDVTAYEDVAGPISLAGKHYRLDPGDIWFAESGDVTADIAQ